MTAAGAVTAGEQTRRRAGVTAGGGGSSSGSGIFADAKVPRCDDGINSQHQLRGTLDGAAVTVGSSVFSDLIKGQYQHLRAVAGEVYVDLLLTWDGSLELDREVSLTGERLVVPQGHPKAGKSICVTNGTFGVTRAAGGAGVQVLFKLTGARDGDCTGRDLPIDIVACTFRKNATLP